jgi:thiamine biosynthesis lipoprotein
MQRNHHILDTDRNASPRRTVSATAIAPDAVTADALSTALFVLDPEHSLALAKTMPQVQTLVMTAGGRRYPSAGWKDHTV